jgi:hypothetical protein
MDIKHISLTDAIALGAATTAVLSAIIAYYSATIAKKALSLTEAEFLSKQEDLSLYQIDAYKLPYSSHGRKFYAIAFNLIITNKSSTPNSVQDLVLEIKFIRGDNTVGAISLTHKNNISDLESGKLPEPFMLPLSLDAKSARTGWGIFVLPNELLKENRIDMYTIGIFDVSKKITTIDSYIIKEVRDDEV